MLDKDNQAKSLIINRIGKDFKSKLNVITNTAFEIYNIIAKLVNFWCLKEMLYY